VTYAEAEPDLTALLREFGPPRKSDHPEQPIWRLQRNGVWTVRAPADLPMKTGNDIPRVTALRSPEVRDGFSPDVRAALAADPSLVRDDGPLPAPHLRVVRRDRHPEPAPPEAQPARHARIEHP
jgi:hypothetical protein